MTHPRSDDSFICPACGTEVPAGAKACPECGSDEETGWSENTVYDGTGIEEPEEFHYEDWKRRELGRGKRRSRSQWMWWVVAVVILAALAWLFVIRQWCAIP